jgi:GT2 family glycosyltransferase
MQNETGLGTVFRRMKTGFFESRLQRQGGSSLQKTTQMPAEWLPFLPDSSAQPDRPAALAGLPKQSSHPILSPRAEISVVMGSLNRFDLLQGAVDSVRREFAGLVGEMIVVDGGSTDGSLQWLVEQQDIITLIQHNRFEENGEKRRRRSWGGFMNMGFRAAAAPNIAMISDDCLLMPGCLSAALDRMEAARAAGVPVGGCAFYFRDWPNDPRYFVQRTLGGNLMINHGIYMRDALEAVGYANEDDYVFYKADTDLSLKIWQQGFCIIDSPGSVCEHYMGVEEELRQSNVALMDYDRAKMRALWPDLTGKSSVQKMGKIFLEMEPFSAAEELWGARYEAECDAQQKALRS